MKHSLLTGMAVAGILIGGQALAAEHAQPVNFDPSAPDSVVCRHMPRAGTSPMLDGRIVCMTNREWDRNRRLAQDQVNEVQRRALMLN